ncbi:MAG: hypothetical protein FWD69_11375 [Polyangiaceae bacterium]|nr:hypothetical protein [Polyangiaceae bacterium]
MDIDRVERLMEQVLSEMQDLRQTAVTSYGLQQQLQELEAQLDAKIEHLEARLDAKIEHLEARLDAKIEYLAHDVKLTQLAVLDLSSEVKRISDNHSMRLDALEGAAQ